jgi:carnitine 3-dehydrogenase
LQSTQRITTDKPVAVLGAGTIGLSWAALFAAHGFDVRIWDPSEKATADVTAFVQRERDRLAPVFGLEQTIGAVEVFKTAQLAVTGAQFVQENSPEVLSVKHELYRSIASSLDPDCIVASSTSSIPPSELQAGMPFAEHIVVGHPFNPPHIMPLVEVVAGRDTSPETVAIAMAFYADLHRKPIQLLREAPGHLANRLQAALWREALHAVQSGLATAEDVDTAMMYGPGPRWALLGPHMTFHLAGGDEGYGHFIDHLGPAFERMWNDLGSASFDEKLVEQLLEGVRPRVAGKTYDELVDSRNASLLQMLKLIDEGK